MNGAQGRSGTTPRSAMPAFGTFGQQQGSASLFLGKSNSSLRRSTPDSEAMASSDDEVEQSKVTAAPNFKKTGRRTSWLNDVSASNSNRKASFGNPYSPSTSHPSTPAAEQTSWNAMTSPSSTWGGANSSFPFNTIWQDNRKEPPTRLQEVLPSHGEQSIPFQIPLKPTPKTYRSQSYSVGQLDTTPAIPTSMPVSTSVEATRSRLGGQYPTLQRRTSRTSGLGDGSGLGRLREVDDNDEEGVTLDQEPETFVTSQARIEKLERENARLRHAAQARERTFSATSASQTQGLSFRNSRIHDSVPEESSPAIDDNDDMPPFVPYANQHNGVRRLSEQIAVHSQAQPLSPIENRPHENVKKAHWQSSLGFESIVEAPQSRRHSFADVPTRHGSFGSTDREGALDTFDSGTQETTRGEDRELALDSCHPTEAEMEKKYLLNRENAATYFHVTESRRREAEARVQQSYMTPNLYGQHSHMGAYLTPSSQPLFIVNFKCCRSDVFYIQDNTGLHVNVGDLVIVEADRGTDLGTVQHTNVTWDEARRYKDYYAEEHYKWLMMFSQQSRNGGPNVVNPNGLPNKQGSAVGGMGPQGHHGPHDVPHTELKPKMIKRLAQNHEIQALKDKEGNEAKAKRVCQQKVVEHRLNMEILDAEFQMDSKKLTFYYFADSYINFNSLVTDLFKIYKTRIWMSAINPASFQTPTASLGIAPPFSGNTSVAGRDSPAGRRRQYPSSNQTSQSPFAETFDTERAFSEQGPTMRNQYYGQFQTMPPSNHQAGPSMTGYSATMQPQFDPFSPYYTPPYPMLNPNAPNFASSRPEPRSRPSNQGSDHWSARFQGLSLGS